MKIKNNEVDNTMEVLHHDISGKLLFRVAWAKDDGKPERFWIEVGSYQVELPAWLAESLTAGLFDCESTGSIQVFHGTGASETASLDLALGPHKNITFHCDAKYQTTEFHFDGIQGRLNYRVAWDEDCNAERFYIEVAHFQIELPAWLAEGLIKRLLFSTPPSVRGEIEFVHPSEEASQWFERRIKEWAAERPLLFSACRA